MSRNYVPLYVGLSVLFFALQLSVVGVVDYQNFWGQLKGPQKPKGKGNPYIGLRPYYRSARRGPTRL